MVKGYGIFSGGLDSILAAMILKDQGIQVRLLTFETPFFGPAKALASGALIDLIPRVVDLTEAHLDMMRQPKHGFGRYMNPCVDCHALMFRKAGEIMQTEGGDFLFSGEVLGQRPKSQTRSAMDVVSRESGYRNYILRPLSARLLPETEIEQRGLVDRSRLLAFSGRTRKPQIALADRLAIRDYPAPAGGCLLADPAFSRRLKALWERNRCLDPVEMEFLKIGRHFCWSEDIRLVVGRNRVENEKLERLARPGDWIIRTETVPGPTAVLVSGGKENLSMAGDIVATYSDAALGETCRISCHGPQGSMALQAVSRQKTEWVVFLT